MLVLVCGGRYYRDMSEMLREINEWQGEHGMISAIVHGGASGADVLAGNVARMSGLAEIVVPAQWDRYGKKAGSMRNGWMLEFVKPDHVLAFPGGKGTENMMKRSLGQGIPVWLLGNHG